ncbi:hypothetical protein NHX12_031177 [Muraenolepis orangiensis]|uniref:Uncharacterized protein n=1 Tax=Muraenolepis orangiensis TaxID=630683 RepID=A0A9Q0IKC5_9TELE|nr:hypothetical protein NHX12_031177 [Muraenolepis orangiensis]
MSEPLLLCVKMDSERQKRKKEIQKALTFIESPLPYADPVSCTVIVSQLVENLLLEGNALYKEGNGLEAVKELSEGLSVVQYSSSEDMLLSPALVGQLYVDRATVYYSLGEYERSVCDCEQALSVNKESSPALLCKALSLKELGLYKEAYNCTTDCLLFTRLELAILLGLKNRKAYVTSRVDLDTLDDFELIGEDLDNLLDCFPNESEPTKTHIPGAFPAPPTSSAHQKPVRFHHTPPGFLPAPSPLLPPAFFSSALGHLNTMDTLSAPGGGGGGGVGGGGRPGPDSRASVLDAFPPHVSHNLDTLDSLDSLDTLDSFTPAPKTQRSRACGEVYRNAGPVAVQPTVPLDQLDTLGSLDQLDTLGSLDQLDTLGSLDQLDTLGSLDQLDTLGILDQLDTPETLDRLDTPDDSQAVQRRGCELGAAYDHTCLDGSLDDFLDSLQGCRAGPAFPSGGDSLDVLDYFAPLEEDVCKPGD